METFQLRMKTKLLWPPSLPPFWNLDPTSAILQLDLKYFASNLLGFLFDEVENCSRSTVNLFEVFNLWLCDFI